MKTPLIYIKGESGDLAARFAAFAGEGLHVSGDISRALRTVAALQAERVVFLFEQHRTEEDLRSIRFLHAWCPDGGIVLIARRPLTDEQRSAYLRAGVHSALPADVPQEVFLRTLEILSDCAFTGRGRAHPGGKAVKLFHMPLWKRTFDVVASAGALLALSPLLAAVAVAVKLDSPGPVIYKSKRVGSNYRVFDFLKFRSMRSDADKRLKELGDRNQYAAATDPAETTKIALDDAEIQQLLARQESGMLFADDFAIAEEEHLQQIGTEQEKAFVKIENDPRITRLGRFLRKYSIDELPQLVNILRGDMSVVGNRPLPLYEAERLTSDEYIERFMCPSGLTGLWQVEKRGHGGRLSPEQRKQLDIRYAREMSPWLDLKIILRTFTAFIQKENV